MKKIAVLTALSLLFASPTMAYTHDTVTTESTQAPLAQKLKTNTVASSKGNIYVGFDLFNGLGTHTIEYSNSYYETSESIDTNTRGHSLNIGYRFPSNIRMELSSTTIKAEFEDTDFTNTYSGYDLNWAFPFAEQKHFSPYFQVGFGLYTFEDSEEKLSQSDDLSGFAANLGIGAIVKLQEQLELDLSYRVKAIAWETAKVGSTDYDIIDSMSNLSLGIRFLF